MTIFLSEAELIELTGYRQPSKQRAHLKAQKIPFHINRAGHPRVARAALEGRTQAATRPEPTWSPAWAASLR